MATKTLQFTVQHEQQTQQFAEQFAKLVSAPLWVELLGGLGAGKTTLTRYLLRALGHQGSVKSPTYTLVEPYQLASAIFYHFDLYRLGEAEELEYLGIRDYLQEDVIGFIEWPSKGKGFLPETDLSIAIKMDAEKRNFSLSANSKKGVDIISVLANTIALEQKK